MADSQQLSTYEETYGSGATFNVMCPATQYWQDTIAEDVSILFNSFGTAGVYIDQIGSAPPKLCFDSTHEHGLGGGDFWVQGYRTLLTKAAAQVKKYHL